MPRQLKHFAFAPLVSIHNDAQRPVTVLEITAPDRPGLLARIGKIFLDFDLSLQNAKIATLGERVEDVFFITDAHNQPLADPELCARNCRTRSSSSCRRPMAITSASAPSASEPGRAPRARPASARSLTP